MPKIIPQLTYLHQHGIKSPFQSIQILSLIVIKQFTNQGGMHTLLFKTIILMIQNLVQRHTSCYETNYFSRLQEKLILSYEADNSKCFETIVNLKFQSVSKLKQ